MRVKEIDGETYQIHIDMMDDLWFLKNIISKGDLVKTIAMRRVEQQEDMTRSKETERKPVTVGIAVESIDFQSFTNRLKILGSIVEGDPNLIGEHQSFIISEGSDLVLRKERWNDIQLNLLDEAQKRTAGIIGLFVTMDDDSAEVLALRGYGIQSLGRVESGKPGKMYDSSFSEKAYFQEIAEILRKNIKDTSNIFILGPGFTRDRFLKFLKEDSVLRGITMKSIPAGRVDPGAVYEFMNSGEFDKSLAQSRVSTESSLMSRFLKELGSSGLCTYGYDEVKKSLETGAAEIVMITEDILPEMVSNPVTQLARETGAKLYVFSDNGEAGKMLRGFGGIAAILRFKSHS